MRYLFLVSRFSFPENQNVSVWFNSGPLLTRNEQRETALRRLLLFAAEHFDFAARLSDLLFRRLREFVRLHGECRLQVAIAEDFDQIVLGAESGLDQDFLVDGLLSKSGKVANIHYRVFGAEDVGEAALGKTAVQRHLSAFEAAHHARAGAGALSFMSAAGCLADAAAHTAANAFLVRIRLFRGADI